MLKNLTNLKISQNLSGFEHLLRQKRHYSFVGNVELTELCYRPEDFEENINEACKFVTTEETCTSAVKLFNYLQLYVCTLKMDSTVLGATLATIVTLIILALYFVCLYVVSRYFLLPNSIVLANFFNMKNYDFGVTILGPLFTLPSLFGYIFSCTASNRSSSLVYAQGFGYLFTTFVIGTCLLSLGKDFRLHPRIFVREMLFLSVGVFYIHYVVEFEADNYNTPSYESSKSNIVMHTYIMLTVYAVYALNIILFSRSRYKKPEVHIDPNHLPSSSESIDSDSYPDFYENPIEHDIDPFDLFIECINPAEAESLRNSSKFVKVILYPFYCILALFIPVVRRKRRLHGWCKCIFCISFITFPFYFLKWNLGRFFNTTVIIFGVICALVVFFLSHNQRLPINHDLVSFWGLLFGIAIFNIIDAEIDALVWQLLTYIANWKYDTIVIVAFPLSYVFVEGILMITLLKTDFRRMASGFVIGYVMFLAYTLVPVTVYSVCFAEEIYLLSGRTTTAFYFMVIVEGMTVFGLSLTGFVLRPSFSIFLVIVQAVYSLFMILSDGDTMHPYGNISIRTFYFNALHVQWA